MVHRRNALAILGVLMATFAATPAQAEIRKLMKVCPERRLCPSFELVLTPPPNWAADAAASEEQKVQVLLPRGRSFHNADAVIYVRVSLKQNDQDLAEFIRVSQERWRQAVPDSKISKLPSVARANGNRRSSPTGMKIPAAASRDMKSCHSPTIPITMATPSSSRRW